MNNPYVNLAKSAVEVFIKEGQIISLPEDLPREILDKKSGVFVTIESSFAKATEDKEKKLRGCIGTYLPTQENIAQEIIHNAIAAATEDYRFGPITEKELPKLSYTVYLLSEPELVRDIKELNPKRYGIIVKTRPIFSSKNLGGQAENDVVFNGHLPYKSGLLLPDLEGINTVDQQIAIACQKGGIDLSKEQISIYCFTVKRHML